MNQHSGRILIVEDDAPIAELLSVILSSEGYEVDVAASAAEAKRLLSRVQPQLLILDLALPEVDGVQFLRELRAESDWSMLPVIVVSAFPYLPLDQPVTARFAKPPDVTRLLEAVAAALAEQALPGAI